MYIKSLFNYQIRDLVSRQITEEVKWLFIDGFVVLCGGDTNFADICMDVVSVQWCVDPHVAGDSAYGVALEPRGK